MILLIDNYDSFSYNLFQLVGSMEPDIVVARNDAYTVAGALALAPEAVIISPGPGRPEDAGICVELARALPPHIPLLGVCLGHQAICHAYGATVGYAAKLMHGKQSTARLEPDAVGTGLFAGLAEELPVARYHSLSVDADTLPAELAVTSRAEDGEVMSVRHRSRPVFGLQFHPESILTPDGPAILGNFIQLARMAGNRQSCVNCE